MLRNFRTKALKALLLQRVSFFWFVFFLCIATKKENEQIKKDCSLCLFISFLFLRRKRKETNQRKEKGRLSKETVKCFIGDFSATGCCKNHLKTQLFLTKSQRQSRKTLSCAALLLVIFDTDNFVGL